MSVLNIPMSEFEEAYSKLQKILPKTPLIKNDWLSSKYGANIYLKLENLQPVGSFKLRGAINKMANFTDEQKKKGVVAVSAGNHAQGVAWSAKRLGIEATIIMPKPSPLVKIFNTENLGAKVILEGDNVDESFEFCKKYLEENDAIFVHPFHDPEIIAGQGTIALELKEQIEHIDFLFGSIGGGGLMAGMGTVLKSVMPNIKLVAAQATGASSMIKSLQRGEVINGNTVATFADGIKVKNPVPEMYELLDSIIDEAIHIPDDMIAASVLRLMEQAGVIAEGAGAINLAAFHELYESNPRRFKNKNIVLVICGGNIDINVIDRIIDRGLVETKRRMNISILLDDKPGALKQLTKVLSHTGANVLEIYHERSTPHIELQQSIVRATLETKGSEHCKSIISELEKEFQIFKREI
jgi:threonine dehydratase